MKPTRPGIVEVRFCPLTFCRWEQYIRAGDDRPWADRQYRQHMRDHVNIPLKRDTNSCTPTS